MPDTPLSLQKAVETDRLDDFIKQEEERLAEYLLPEKRSVERAVAALIKAPRPSNRT